MPDEQILLRIRLIIDDASSVSYEIETREGEGPKIDPSTGKIVPPEKIKVRGATLDAAFLALESQVVARKAAR